MTLTFDLRHCFVLGRIETLAECRNLANAVFAKNIEKPFENHFHAFDERLAIAATRSMGDRAFEIVDHREEVLDQSFVGETNASSRSRLRAF